tara:strand:+ start:438 stop:1385 length:948 start_codon:yes stop_codon:yes gene_type:complete
MIKKTITVRISNGLGNQMFMYASALAIAKKMNRELLVDNETAFSQKKSITEFSLDIFKISSEIAPKHLKFNNFFGYLKRKFLLKTDFFRKNNLFYIEKKNRDKISQYQEELFNENSLTNIFLEGHLETEKYFKDIRNVILEEFKFKNIELFTKSKLLQDIQKNNAVAICLRQNRFEEGKNKNYKKFKQLSIDFENEQIDYINKSLRFFNEKLNNPVFYLWANEINKVDLDKFDQKLIKIDNTKLDLNFTNRIAMDLFLISQCKNHIVIPSSFHWWGAWLNNSPNKCILRPSKEFFSKYKINNLDLWPTDWIVIKK